MSAICNVLIIRKSSDESEQVIQAVFRRMPFNETRNDDRTDRKYEPEGAADKKEAADIKEKLADIREIGSEKITVYMEGGEKNGHE